MKDYDCEKFITIVPVQGRAAQKPAYTHCLQEYRDVSRWIGFIDLDEFICLHDADDIRALLADYEDYGGLAASWLTFGSSGHIGRPSGLQIENYTQAPLRGFRGRQHPRQILCSARPGRSKRSIPHKFKYLEPSTTA